MQQLWFIEAHVTTLLASCNKFIKQRRSVEAFKNKLQVGIASGAFEAEHTVTVVPSHCVFVPDFYPQEVMQCDVSVFRCVSVQCKNSKSDQKALAA